MHMLRKSFFSLEEIGTLRRSGNHGGVNGHWRTANERRYNVHDLGLFLIVQLLEDTPAVLSLGKILEEHEYSFEWVSGKNHGEFLMQSGQFRTSCCCRVVMQFWYQFVLNIASSGPAAERRDDPNSANWTETNPKSPTPEEG